MIKRLLNITLLFFFFLHSLHSQTVQEQKVTIVAHDLTLAQVLEQLGSSQGINFSYQGNLPSLKKHISLTMQQQPLPRVLTALFENTDLMYRFFANQVIIQPVVAIPKHLIVEGRICVSGTYDPVPYAGVEFKQLQRGTIADHQGYFRLETDGKWLSDTLRISSLNYEVSFIPAATFLDKGEHTLFLVPKPFELPGIEIRDSSGTMEETGNHKWFRRGSLYIDTHGQQTALYVDNRKKLSGRIIRVSYFLSGKGNTNAPFRVRVYECDSLTGKPGKDMLPEIVVVKPEQGKGWFHVNISRYNLRVPDNGFFVAMEGVFPDDYDYYYQGTDFKGKTDENNPDDEDFTDADLLYGQQLGYTHASVNNTWHFAIDRTWFQLKKAHFNVMITAGIRVREKKNKRKLFNIF